MNKNPNRRGSFLPSVALMAVSVIGLTACSSNEVVSDDSASNSAKPPESTDQNTVPQSPSIVLNWHDGGEPRVNVCGGITRSTGEIVLDNADRPPTSYDTGLSFTVACKIHDRPVVVDTAAGEKADPTIDVTTWYRFDQSAEDIVRRDVASKRVGPDVDFYVPATYADVKAPDSDATIPPCGGNFEPKPTQPPAFAVPSDVVQRAVG